MADLKEQIDSYEKANLKSELSNEKQRAEAIAKLVINFAQNEKGEELANVHHSEGFQEVHDFRGSDKIRWRLDRKKEQVAAGYNASTQLF